MFPSGVESPVSFNQGLVAGEAQSGDYAGILEYVSTLLSFNQLPGIYKWPLIKIKNKTNGNST